MVEHAYDITAQESRRRSRAFFGYVDLKKKSVGYPSVMHFEGRLASGPKEICDLFAEFIPQTNTDDVWVSSDPVAQKTYRMTHLLTHFSSIQMKSRAFGKIWMSTRVPAPMTYHRSFSRTVHLLSQNHYQRPRI
jgi:hypothetical protein